MRNRYQGIILSLFILSVCFGGCKYKGSDMQFEVLKAEVFSKDIQNWMNEKKEKNGAFLYYMENRNEYLFYYNQSNGGIPYETLMVEPELRNSILTIHVTKDNASDDAYVQGDTILYLTLKNKPDTVKVYIDGKEVEYELDVGEGEIKSSKE